MDLGLQSYKVTEIYIGRFYLGALTNESHDLTALCRIGRSCPRVHQDIYSSLLPQDIFRSGCVVPVAQDMVRILTKVYMFSRTRQAYCGRVVLP